MSTDIDAAATTAGRPAAASPRSPPCGRKPLPGEVVTTAAVRDVSLPGGAGTLALITLDNGHDHTRPTTFGLAGLVNLAAALDAVAARAAAGEIVAAGVTGKPFIFCAGRRPDHGGARSQGPRAGAAGGPAGRTTSSAASASSGCPRSRS